MRRLFYFLLLASLPGFGQHLISGKILSSNGQPLEGAFIHLGNRKDISGPAGAFSFANVGEGRLRLRAIHTGFVSFDSIIVANKSLQLTIRLADKPLLLKEVTIASAIGDGISQTAKVRRNNLKRNMSQSLADLLSEIPGVTAVRTGSTISKPMIHGLHSSRVPIIANGLRLEDQGWGIDHAPTFAIGQAEKISVIKGAGTLQYAGDAIGGVVLIEAAESAVDSLFGSITSGFHTNGRGGGLNAAVTRSNNMGWTWKLKADTKYFGDKETPSYMLSNSGNRELSFTVDVLHKGRAWSWGGSASAFKTNLGILRASHIGNAADLYYSINNMQPYNIVDFTYDIDNPRQEVLHLTGRFFARREFSENSKWELQYQMQYNRRYEFDLRRGANRNKAALDLALTTHSGLLDGIWKKDRATLRYGLLASYQHNFANPDTGVRPLIPIYDKVDSGGYAILEQDLDPAIAIEAGIRYDFSYIVADKFYLKSRWDERGYSPQFDHFIVADANTQWRAKPNFDYHNLSASLGVRYRPNDVYNLVLSVTRRIRNPNPAELFSDGLHHSTGMIELGSLDLKQEKATKASVDFSLRADNWNISVGPFVNSISHFMYLYPVGFETTIRGVFPVWEFRQTNALLSGIDVSGAWDLHQNWRYSIQGSWLYGWDDTQKEYLIDIPPPNLTQKLGFTHSGWHRLTIELSHQLVAGQTRYPNANFDTNIVVDGQLVPVTVDISTPPPGYGLWNYYSEMTFDAGSNRSLIIGLGMMNLTNKSYRNYLNRQRFYADEAGRNVMLQIRLTF